jgi:hypothetical protein
MKLALSLVLLLLPLGSRAQSADTDSAATVDTIFVRVQRLAANGQGDAARALVQQTFEAAPTASPRYVEALYWRAVVAATAADAERDLRTLIVDYPLSPWSEEALMRLAQLEMTRGEMDKALAHLERVTMEHPNSTTRPRAEFWMARVMFEQGRAPDACRHLGNASRSVAAGDVELKNQIDYWMARCIGVDTTVVTPPPTAVATAAAPPPAPPAAPAAVPAKRQFCVQVAAYDSRESADKLVKRLHDRGYDARVYGAMAPYRVRIGRYDSRAQADSAAQRLNAKKITGFVTEAEPK